VALFKDEVVLTLNGESTRIVENSEVRSSILTQPAGFALRLGHGGVVADLLKRYPEQTPFQLRVNDTLVQTGYTDGDRTQGAGGTQVTFDGRDVMGKVVSAFAPSDKTYSNLTYRELTDRILREVGFDLDNETLLFSDDVANRKAISGTVITKLTNSEVEVTTRQEDGSQVTDSVAGTRKTTYRSSTVKVGKSYYEFLKTQLDRAGLFLWAAGEGHFVLSFPSPSQTPAYRISRVKRDERGLGNVVDHSFTRNTVQRYTKLIVHGRGGGRKVGRTKISGECIDPEMVERFGGENKKILPIHDNDIQTVKQAQHFARRRMAELNREGWQLSYVMSGLSTMQSANGARALWTPNTVVEVDDNELGIHGNFWVEEVQMKITPQSTTTVRLMRLSDMFFSQEAA
jgi:prophage tail gpP-like protein